MISNFSNQFKFAFYLLSVLFLCNSCAITKSNVVEDASPLNVFEPSYYEDASNNLERLYRILSGVYTFYHAEKAGSDSIVRWSVNDQQDSIMGLSLPIGEVEKYGYWLYNVQFMTNLPNKPVMVGYIKLEQISRDSILAIYYSGSNTILPTDIVQNKESVLEDIAFDELEETAYRIVYTKESNTKFHGISNTQAQDYKGKQIYKNDSYTVNINEVSFYTTFYEDEDATKPPLSVRAKNILYRVDPKKSSVIKYLDKLEVSEDDD